MAIVMCARRCVKVIPVWNPEMGYVSGLEENEVEPCYLALMSHYEQTFPDQKSQRTLDATKRNQEKV